MQRSLLQGLYRTCRSWGGCRTRTSDKTYYGRERGQGAVMRRRRAARDPGAGRRRSAGAPATLVADPRRGCPALVVTRDAASTARRAVAHIRSVSLVSSDGRTASAVGTAQGGGRSSRSMVRDATWPARPRACAATRARCRAIGRPGARRPAAVDRPRGRARRDTPVKYSASSGCRRGAIRSGGTCTSRPLRR